jgi:hypothetical protein
MKQINLGLVAGAMLTSGKIQLLTKDREMKGGEEQRVLVSSKLMLISKLSSRDTTFLNLTHIFWSSIESTTTNRKWCRERTY